MNIRQFLFALISLIPVTGSNGAVARELVIIADIAPIHAIVSSLTQGVQTPVQLIGGGQSGHDFALKPSNIRALQSADIVIWNGPDATPGLAKLLLQKDFAEKTVDLSSLPNTRLHSMRAAGVFDMDKPILSATIDPHSWLDPANAIYWSDYLTRLLIATDPENAVRYSQNNERFQESLAEAVKEIEMGFATAPLPLIQFHDAFQYFERAFGISPVGSVTSAEDEEASLGILSDLRKEISHSSEICVLVQTSTQTKIARPLFSTEHAANFGFIDPLGYNIEPQDYTFERLLLTIADGFGDCIARP